jgi:hypothetical protein
MDPEHPERRERAMSRRDQYLDAIAAHAGARSMAILRIAAPGLAHSLSEAGGRDHDHAGVGPVAMAVSKAC